MARKRIFLVAGHDYEHSGVSFRALCNNRMERLKKTHPDAIFVIYDVSAGEVATFKPRFILLKNKKPAWVETRDTTRFKPVTRKNYSRSRPDHPYRFDSHPAGIMSITDIYNDIIALGSNEDTRGTLAELSIFSHGWFGGAILVNSNDPFSDEPDPKRDPEKRDPDDKDSRPKDFHPKNISSDKLKTLRAAFTQDAICRLWGCSFADIFFYVVHKTIQSSRYRKTRPQDLKDSDVFTYRFTQREAEEAYDQAPSFFPKPVEVEVLVNKKKVKKKKFELSFERTLKQTKDFLRNGFSRTYAQRLATATGRPCFSAYLGTYSDYEAHQGATLPLMLIPRKSPPYVDDFTRVIQFYKDVMKIPEDPESRGYGTYMPSPQTPGAVPFTSAPAP